MRLRLALALLEIGFWLLPNGAYKSQLNRALWAINLDMQATIAAAQSAQKKESAQ